MKKYRYVEEMESATRRYESGQNTQLWEGVFSNSGQEDLTLSISYKSSDKFPLTIM